MLVGKGIKILFCGRADFQGQERDEVHGLRDTEGLAPRGTMRGREPGEARYSLKRESSANSPKRKA